MHVCMYVVYACIYVIGSTNVTQNWFHKRYTYICAYVYMYACMYDVYAFMYVISSTSVAQNSTSVT